MRDGLSILFDPAIDGAAWPGLPGDRAATAGEMWVGPLGLLDRVEIELGLGGVRLSDVERAGVVAGALDGEGGWWRASYEADPLGTAERLLADRDALRMWGWSGEPVSPRLDELWRVTRDAPVGVADRVLAAGEALLRRRVDVESLTVIAGQLATLPTGWRTLVARLGEAGVELREVAPATAEATGDLARARAPAFAPAGDGSLTLLRPHGRLAAADEVAAWLAGLPALDGVVVVGADDTLDAALARHGLPRSGAPTRGPASLALVRLVLEAAFEPMEPGELHALLCLDPGPVPRRVAWRLVRALGRLPGRRAPGFAEALAEGLARCDDDWRPEVEARLRTLLMPAARRDDPVAATEIARRLDALRGWAAGRAPLAASQAARLAGLLELTRRPALTLVELRRLCDELDERAAGPAEAGLAAVRQPGALLAPAERVVWWDFTRQRAPVAPRLRLSLDERAALGRAGVTPPDGGAVMAGEAARWRRPLELAARALLLVCPATDEAGERVFPHPLWDELRAAMPRPSDAARLERRRLDVARLRPAPRALPRPRTVIDAGAALALRGRESPSSLERLLGCSLAWALAHHARLRPGLEAGPATPSPQLYGVVAHHLLARVFADGALDGDAAAARAQALVERELAETCESLELARYQLEGAALRQAVVDSARALGALLAATGATVRGAEVEAERDLGGVAIAGRADLVLAAPDVVIDLKWGRSKNRDLLARGAALQLAAYGALFADGDARPEVAYFILNRQELLTDPGSRLPGARSCGAAHTADTWRAALAGVAARRAELDAGLLHAPGADGSERLSRLDGGALTVAPPCGFCDYAALCGNGRST